MARRVVLVSVGLMGVGFGGGYALADGWVSFVLHHVGALGASSLLACAAAVIASKKGYGFWRAFSYALCVPLLLGLVAAYLVPPGADEGRPAACGGPVSLPVALLFILTWALLKQRPERPNRAKQSLSHG